MTYREYLLLMGGATVAAWVGWLVVLFAVDPSRTGAFGFLLFYLMFFSALLGTFSVMGTSLRVWLRKQEVVSRHVERSLRQGALFSLMVLGTFFLLPRGLFRWWTVSLLILATSLIELSFLASKAGRRS